MAGRTTIPSYGVGPGFVVVRRTGARVNREEAERMAAYHRRAIDDPTASVRRVQANRELLANLLDCIAKTWPEQQEQVA